MLRRYDDFLLEFLMETKRRNLSILEQLPCKLSAKPIVALYKSLAILEDLRDTLLFLFILVLIFCRHSYLNCLCFHYDLALRLSVILSLLFVATYHCILLRLLFDLT